MKSQLSVLVVLSAAATSVSAFSTALFPEATSTPQHTFPTKGQGVEIELPNFDELFGRIQQVSPLARLALDENTDGPRGFAGIDKTCKLRKCSSVPKIPLQPIILTSVP